MVTALPISGVNYSELDSVLYVDDVVSGRVRESLAMGDSPKKYIELYVKGDSGNEYKFFIHSDVFQDLSCLDEVVGLEYLFEFVHEARITASEMLKKTSVLDTDYMFYVHVKETNMYNLNRMKENQELGFTLGKDK